MNGPHDRRPPPGKAPRVHTDETGHSVWDDTVQTASFELVSTQQLKALLEQDGDASGRDAIRDLAAGDDEGFLARDAATGMFHVIDDNDLQALLDTQHDDLPELRKPAEPKTPARDTRNTDDELSLVSTQRLRKILDIPEDRSKPSTGKPRRDEGGGFNPYDSG